MAGARNLHGAAENTSVQAVYLSETDADQDLRFDYVRYSSTGTALIQLRYTGGNDRLWLEIQPTQLLLRQVDGGTLSNLATYSTTVSQNAGYSARVELDGGSVKVWWGTQGGDFNQVISATTTELTTSRAAMLRANANTEHGWDNIQLIVGTRSTVETFTYNDANEQITHTKNGVTTDMTYDEWGRLEERDDGTHTATYAYRYGSKLYSVTSDFVGEGNVTYETGGDQKRRSRVAGLDETWYNYTNGLDVVSTEDEADGSSGDLTMTNVVLLPILSVSMVVGDLAGTTPASGTARYYATDHLGSTRNAWDGSKASVGAYEFAPYGGEYAHAGAPLATLAGTYTGKPWDGSAQLFHFPYRQYSPDLARWTTRDPLGMVDGTNFYSYVRNSPLKYKDWIGLQASPYYAPHGPDFHDWARQCREAAEQVKNDTLSIRWLNHGLPRDAKRHAKMQHCVSACELKKKAGHMCSVIAGWGEEIFGGEFQLEDASMNQKGRDCACGKLSCIACCKDATK